MSLWSGDCALCYLQELWHRGTSQPEYIGIPELGLCISHPPKALRQGFSGLCS